MERRQALAGVTHRTISHSGKGSAIRTGIGLATGDIVLIQDGDLEYDPNDYARILEPIAAGRADIVYGSRFLGKPVAMALPNRIANGDPHRGGECVLFRASDR